MGAITDYLKLCWNQGKENAETLKAKQREKIKKIRSDKDGKGKS